MSIFRLVAAEESTVSVSAALEVAAVRHEAAVGADAAAPLEVGEEGGGKAGLVGLNDLVHGGGHGGALLHTPGETVAIAGIAGAPTGAEGLDHAASDATVAVGGVGESGVGVG